MILLAKTGLFLLTILFWCRDIYVVDGLALHTKKHPDRFKLSSKPSKRVRNTPLKVLPKCKIKLSKLDRSPQPIPLVKEHEGPEQLDEAIKDVEDYLDMPGAFAKYFHDPEIEFLRTDPKASVTLLQAFQKPKDERTVRQLRSVVNVCECKSQCL
jgi:hypothetical protein